MSGRPQTRGMSESPGPGAYSTLTELGQSPSYTMGAKFTHSLSLDGPGPGDYAVNKPKSAPGKRVCSKFTVQRTQLREELAPNRLLLNPLVQEHTTATRA